MKRYLDELRHWDISPLVSEKSAVYPGDTPFSRRVLMDMNDGDHLGLSSIQTTVHVGSHADAPCHYHAQGQSIDQRDLNYYMGKAQVICAEAGPNERLTLEHIQGQEICAQRVLFKTGSFPDPNLWSDEFNSLDPELIEALHEQGVVLVGIDTPSIDPAREPDLKSHHKIYEKNMAILEGLVLEGVEAGLYQLVAFPLKIQGADASPVRAVLFELEAEEKRS